MRPGTWPEGGRGRVSLGAWRARSGPGNGEPDSKGRLRTVQPALVWTPNPGELRRRLAAEASAWHPDYLLSAPPANGWCAVFAPAMTVSIVGSFFSARSIDSLVAGS